MKDLAIRIDDYKFNFRVCALIENKGRYLLSKNKNDDFFNMPGGRVHVSENTHDAIIRELKEELDVDFSNYNLHLLKVAEEFFSFSDTNYHEIDFVYYIKLKDGHKLCKQDEIQNKDNTDETCVWIKKKDLHNHKILPEFIYDIKGSKHISHLIFDKINNKKYE